MCAFERSGVGRTAVIVTNPTRGSFTFRWISSPSTSRIDSPTRCVLRVAKVLVLPRLDVGRRVQDLDAVVAADETFDLAQHLLGVERGVRHQRNTERRSLPLIVVIDF